MNIPRHADARRVLARAFISAFTLLCGATPAAGQKAAQEHLVPEPLCTELRAITAPQLASPLDELRRVAGITGCAPFDQRVIRRTGQPADANDLSTWLNLDVLPAELVNVGRSGYAGDMNNGALWEGVGLSTALRAGALLRVPFVTVSLRPELIFEQNSDFHTRSSPRPGFSEYASPFYGGIDLPQRFGAESRTRVVPGESYARVDVGPAAAGISTESLWRGPALRYPILMSNTAGGFPHIFIGTSRGVNVFVGDLHAEFVVGRLEESDYFDSIAENDATGLVNLSVALDVRWLDGLTVGATRSTQYRAGDGSDFDRVIEALGFDITSNLPGSNELASVFGRWVFTESGAEVYAEWARDDVIGEWDEFLMEPDHAQAYLFGFQKVTPVSDALSVRVHGELAHLQEKGEARTDSRPLAVLYTHSTVHQGYTHRGQLLGAGIGPGADAQFLAADVLLRSASIGGYFERIRRNDLTTAAFDARRWSPFEHDTEITGGVRGVYFRAPLAFSGSLSRSLRYNRDFEGDDHAWRLELRLHWTPDSRHP